MAHRTPNRRHPPTKSYTLPSSPTHSSSSSDFEFTISLSPRKSSSAALCPADELFYKGQLLPLHLSPRLSLVRTLLLSSTSTSSSSDTTTTASRDSTASSSSFSTTSTDSSSRPSSATDDDLKPLTTNNNNNKKPSKYFSLSKFSSVFRKDKNALGGAAVKRVSSSAKEAILKYFNKVKPLYEKLSQKQQQQQQEISRPTATSSVSRISRSTNTTLSMMNDHKNQDLKENPRANISLSFSGNLRYPTRGKSSCISSCPSSMGSSPSHGKTGFGSTQMGRTSSGMFSSDTTSSMEELQSAIQGAIAHCKNSMLLNNKAMVSNEI